MMLKPTFLIDTPVYRTCSGGTRTLHYLAALLVEAGFSTATTRLCYFNPMISVRAKAQPGDIAVYPDCISGNPLGADQVCRWMLFFADKYFKSRVTENECVLTSQLRYLASVQAACDHKVTEDDIVYLPHIDGSWCFPGIKTIKNCLYAIESANKSSIVANPNLANVYVIPNAVEPQAQDKSCDDQHQAHYRTLAILRASENFYSVDHHTALSVEAALCGCRVWNVMPDGSFQEEKYDSVDMEQWVINPAKDRAAALKFAERVRCFFGL